MIQMLALIRRGKGEEKGSVVVLFAASLVVLLAFVSLAVDVGLINMKKAKLMDMCQQMRQARLDTRDFIMNSDNPALLIYQIANDCAIDNGFVGGLKVYYTEETDPAYPATKWVDSRFAKVRIELTQEYRVTAVMAAFTGTEYKEIKVYLDGSEKKSSSVAVDPSATTPVWYPYGTLKKGSYARTENTGAADPAYNAGDVPAEW